MTLYNAGTHNVTFVEPSGAPSGNAASLTVGPGQGALLWNNATGCQAYGCWSGEVIGGTAAQVTLTVANTTTIGANACVPAAGSGGTSVTMAGLTSAMTLKFTPTTDTSNVTGWGNPAGGVLYILPLSGSGAFTYHVCNNTSSSITTSASVTFNVTGGLQ
jgi:hypothetical protein